MREFTGRTKNPAFGGGGNEGHQGENATSWFVAGRHQCMLRTFVWKAPVHSIHIFQVCWIKRSEIPGASKDS